MKAGAEEESLQSAIKGGNSDRITKAIEALHAAPKTAMSMIEGDWQAGAMAAYGSIWQLHVRNQSANTNSRPWFIRTNALVAPCT